MITTWNLVDEKVTSNSSEIRIWDCFLNFAIKYHQKTDITLNEFKSDLFKLVNNETELYIIMFFSDIYVICCYDAFFGFADSGAWHERHDLIVDKTNNDCLNYTESSISIFTILDNPTKHCNSFSNDLIDFESLCTNCKKHFIKSTSVKLHCFKK